MHARTGLLFSALALLAAPLYAADVTPTEDVTSAAASDVTYSMQLVPRLFVFDYFDGVGADRTQFLERYDYREDGSGDTRSGAFADLDFSLRASERGRDLLSLERLGFGQNNHRGSLRLDTEPVGASAGYTHYRSATGGIDYLFNPNLVPGALPPAPYSVFNDDGGRADYHVDRTRYDAGFKLKPALLGGLATVAVDYQGYHREGNKFAPFYIQTPGIPSDTDRWRAISLDIDEHMNKVALTLSAAPQQRLDVAYEVSLEQFTNSSPELQLERDILIPAGVSTAGLPGIRQRIAPLFYTPDTKMVNQGLRLSHYLGERSVLAAGYSSAWLKQESFSERELLDGHTRGQINTDNAYVTLSSNLHPRLGVEAHLKSYRRENDSSFPDGLIGTGAGTGQLTGPRINHIDSLDYGLAAHWRTGMWRSSLTLGWRRLDTERDLTFGTDIGADILPAQSLYREDTLTDELYLKWIARPAAGVTVRLTPSMTWASTTARASDPALSTSGTGLVSEPEEAFAVKTLVSYAAPAGWLVSGFYDYRYRLNDGHTWADAGGATPQTYNQRVESTFNSAGVSLNLTPRERLNTFVNLFWLQDDFSSYYFRTNVQRWNPLVVFTLVDEPAYRIDTWSLGLGTDWRATDKLTLSGGYTFARSQGAVASGSVETLLQAATGSVDASVDNRLHSLSIAADYALSESVSLRGSYFYDYYRDDAYDLLTGGTHMFTFGVALRM